MTVIFFDNFLLGRRLAIKVYKYVLDLYCDVMTSPGDVIFFSEIHISTGSTHAKLQNDIFICDMVTSSQTFHFPLYFNIGRIFDVTLRHDALTDFDQNKNGSINYLVE